MNKQEYIKLKWQEAGFIWDEIKFIVSPVTGGMQLQHPSLKTSLTGYSEAHSKGILKGYDFDGYGLKVWNKLLDGIDHNNGWTKIESEKDLPINKTIDYNVVVDGLRGYRKAFYDNGKWCFFHLDSEGNRHLANYDKVTHFRQIIEIPNPLY